MASTQQLKARIGSVRNTRQITKAMELVSASKMRRAQEATLASRDYTKTAQHIMKRLRSLTDVEKNPLFTVRPVQTRILIVITSDRGLAGAYNANVLRQLTKELQSDRENNISTKLLLVGKQAARFAAKINDIEVIGSYDSMPEKPTMGDLTSILQTVKEAFIGKTEFVQADIDSRPKKQKIDPEVDAVDILFTDFRSSVLQEVTQQRLLPAAFHESSETEASEKDTDTVIFEPSANKILDEVADRLVDVQLWQAFLESQASEQSARMMAMKTASDNAGDLIDDLTLAMNTARQAAITQELAEITGGAEAIK
jgi:F-type H+-transporting ATPase subunit gamma